MISSNKAGSFNMRNLVLLKSFSVGLLSGSVTWVRPQKFYASDWSSWVDIQVSGASIPIFSLENHQADHDGDQADGSHHQSEDDGRRRVAELLRGTILEKGGVDVHEGLLHQRVGPRDQEAVGDVLGALAQVTVNAAAAETWSVRAGSSKPWKNSQQVSHTYPLILPQMHQSLSLRNAIAFSNLLRHKCWTSTERQSMMVPS